MIILIGFSPQAAKPDTIQERIWNEVIMDTPNQVKDVSTGLIDVVEKDKVICCYVRVYGTLVNRLIFLQQLHYGASLGIRGLLTGPLKHISCNIIELPMQFQKLNSAMGFQKNSELVPLFNYHIGKLTEQGQVNSWEFRFR